LNLDSATDEVGQASDASAIALEYEGPTQEEVHLLRMKVSELQKRLQEQDDLVRQLRLSLGDSEDGSSDRDNKKSSALASPNAPGRKRLYLLMFAIVVVIVAVVVGTVVPLTSQGEAKSSEREGSVNAPPLVTPPPSPSPTGTFAPTSEILIVVNIPFPQPTPAPTPSPTPVPTPSPTPEEPIGGGSLPGGAIAGIVVAVLVCVTGGVIGIIYLSKQQREGPSKPTVPEAGSANDEPQAIEGESPFGSQHHMDPTENQDVDVEENERLSLHDVLSERQEIAQQLHAVMEKLRKFEDA